MMIRSLICSLVVLVSVVYSQGVGPDSDRCLKDLLPKIGQCDAEIVVIDKECNQEFKTLDQECKGKDTMECLQKYMVLTKTCEDRRKNYKTKCGLIYAAFKRECTGAYVAPATGPESARCLKDLVAQLATCDAEIATIERHCTQGIKNIDVECKGKDTDECGQKYIQFNAGCDAQRKVHNNKCGHVLATYRKECQGISAAPATGPESDRCMKQLLPAIGSCDAEIATIDRECARGFRNIDAECKGKDSMECLQRYVQYTAACDNKRKVYNAKCVPIYSAHKKECTGAPVAPQSGPDSDRCLKQLVPAMAVCDAEIVRIDKHCNRGFKKIDRRCKGVDTEECGQTYVRFNAECDGKRRVHKNKCGSTMRAYKSECVAKGK